MPVTKESEAAALDTLHALVTMLPGNVGALASLALGLARTVHENETDPVAYLASLVQSHAQEAARARFGV